MREIKFRAFDKNNKRMMIFDDFWACDEYQLLGWILNDDSKLKSEGDYCLDWDRHNLEIMQYTGLKDKNGKEIWEGDIVRIGNGETDPCGVPLIGGDGIHVVEYDEKRGCFSHTHTSNGLGEVFSKHTEIIGNIYEHSELINNQKEK